MIRTPYLGYSCFNIFNQRNKFESELKVVDSYQLLLEIRKCLLTIKEIIDNEYIHADIRPPNVMYNFNTNKLTIIDFDLFMPKQEYLSKHILNNNKSSYDKRIFPSDSAPLFENFDASANPIVNIKNITRKAYLHLLNNQYKTYKLFCDSIKFDSIVYNYTKVTFTNTVTKIMEYIKIYKNDNTIKDVNNIKTLIFDKVYPYMDLWGFGYSILLLCILIFKYKPNDDTMVFILSTLLKGILHPDINNRINVDDAIRECDGYIRRYKESMNSDSMYGGKRKSRRKSRRQRKTRKH
jgi:serine/threonine protein kinase